MSRGENGRLKKSREDGGFKRTARDREDDEDSSGFRRTESRREGSNRLTAHESRCLEGVTDPIPSTCDAHGTESGSSPPSLTGGPTGGPESHEMYSGEG